MKENYITTQPADIITDHILDDQDIIDKVVEFQSWNPVHYSHFIEEYVTVVEEKLLEAGNITEMGNSDLREAVKRVLLGDVERFFYSSMAAFAVNMLWDVMSTMRSGKGKVVVDTEIWESVVRGTLDEFTDMVIDTLVDDQIIAA